MRKLTSTSYAVLCLLHVKPWTGYELAQQMGRSMSWLWPRAVSGVYQEPKVLVAHGLAKARTGRTGRRPYTEYAITPKGRKALRAWLGESSAPPVFESEALVRLSFADAGDKDQLLATLAEFRAQVDVLRERILGQVHDYLSPDHGPFPARLHIIALDARFVFDYLTTLRDYADWATDQVENWPSTTPEDPGFAIAAIQAIADEAAAKPLPRR